MSVTLSEKLQMLDRLSGAYTRAMYLTNVAKACGRMDETKNLQSAACDLRRQIDILRTQVGKEWQDSAKANMTKVFDAMPRLEMAVNDIHKQIDVINAFAVAINVLQQLVEIAAAVAV